jgi:hypothetical protein
MLLDTQTINEAEVISAAIHVVEHAQFGGPGQVSISRTFFDSLCRELLKVVDTKQAFDIGQTMGRIKLRSELDQREQDAK